MRRYKTDTPEVRPTDLPRVTLSSVQVERSKYIANRLIDEGGFTPEQAAGIVGNLIHESQLDPQSIGGVTQSGRQARGIAQWLHPERVSNFRNFTGVDVANATLEQQTDFLLHELKRSHRGAAGLIRNTNTIQDAAVTTSRKYEQPGRAEANEPKRKAYSYQVYDLLP